MKKISSWVLIKLIISSVFFVFLSPIIYGQNVGIGKTSPSEKLDVAGNLNVDSAMYVKGITVKDTLQNKRIVLDGNEGKLQMWANDTMWYQLMVSSPPGETVTGENGVTIERRVDLAGPSLEVRNATGMLIWKEFTSTEYTGFDTSGLEEVTVTQYFSSGCLRKETKIYQKSGKESVIYYNCPGGDTSFVDERYPYFNSPEVTDYNRKKNYEQPLIDYYHGDLMGPGSIESFAVLFDSDIPSSHFRHRLGADFAELDLSLPPSDDQGTIKLEPSRLIINFDRGSNNSGLRFGGEGVEFFCGDADPSFEWSIDFEKDNTDPKNVRQRITKGTSEIYVDNRPAERTVEWSPNPAGPTAPPFEFNVNGLVNKLGGSFRIDHPLDPYNKILYHSFVESPDMMNVYNGNITTDEKGLATVQLPDYFEALNIDFRYQLTVIGEFAQAIVQKKIVSNSFVIQTDKPNVEVSWQVTGIRNDTFARKHRIKAEVEKSERLKGKLLYQ